MAATNALRSHVLVVALVLAVLAAAVHGMIRRFTSRLTYLTFLIPLPSSSHSRTLFLTTIHISLSLFLLFFVSRFLPFSVSQFRSASICLSSAGYLAQLALLPSHLLFLSQISVSLSLVREISACPVIPSTFSHPLFWKNRFLSFPLLLCSISFLSPSLCWFSFLLLSPPFFFRPFSVLVFIAVFFTSFLFARFLASFRKH